MSVRAATLSHYAEYIALRVVIGVLKRLGVERAAAIGERIGLLGYSPLGLRKAVVERQVRAAFPGLAEQEVWRIARASYANLGRVTIDAAVMADSTPAQIAARFERVEGWDVVERVRARGKGMIIVAGHLGNWELGGAYIATRGIPLEAVARRMQNPLFDRFLTKTRESMGLTVVHDADAVRRVPRVLREGNIAAFMFDQGAAGLASTWVPFFGRLAKTPRGPAVFALRLDAPVVFATAVRQANGRYLLALEEVVAERSGDREEDTHRIVAQMTAQLERWVRRYPEQYFWQHRRWKHQRPGTAPELGDPS